MIAHPDPLCTIPCFSSGCICCENIQQDLHCRLLDRLMEKRELIERPKTCPLIAKGGN